MNGIGSRSVYYAFDPCSTTYEKLSGVYNPKTVAVDMVSGGVTAGVLYGIGALVRNIKAGKPAANTSRTTAIDGNGKLPNSPKPGSLDDVATRKWYLDAESKIPNLIDKTKPLEQQAKQAFDLRNQFRDQARSAMSNRSAAEALYKTDPNMTWNQIVVKYTSKGLSGDSLWQEIIEASTRSRSTVTQSLGLG